MTSDDSPPNIHHWMLYARQKAHAELFLRDQMKSGIGVTVLRPGLVWGPGSTYCASISKQLVSGAAWLSNQGQGICNLIYVDNLIHCILAIARHPEAVSGFYNVCDPETVIWRQFYEGIAEELGLPITAVGLVADARFRPSPSLLLDLLLQRKPIYRLSKLFLDQLSPDKKTFLKRFLQYFLGQPHAPPPPHYFRGPIERPRFSREYWYLQNTRHPLSNGKFMRQFGPINLVPFREAMAATGEWLRYAGFAPAFGTITPDNGGVLA